MTKPANGTEPPLDLDVRITRGQWHDLMGATEWDEIDRILRERLPWMFKDDEA